MGITVGHAHTLTMGDGTNTNLVKPSDWNSNHVVSVSHANNEVIKYIKAGANSVSSGTVEFGSTAGGNVTFGMAAGGYVTANAPAGGGGAIERRYKELILGERMTTCAALSATQYSNRPIFSPFWMDGTGIALNTVRFIMSIATSSNRSLGGTFQAGLYYQSSGNSTQATLISSATMNFSITATSQGSAYQGGALLDFVMTGHTITTEGRYVMAFMVNPVSANITWMPASLYGGDPMPALSRVLAGGTTGATGVNVLPWWGVYTTTTGAMPNSIGPSHVAGANSASLVDFYCIIKEY